MYEIVKAYKQEMPASRFIGIEYHDEDRVNGGFGFQWGDWFEKGRFAILEGLLTEDFIKSFEDTDAYIGLMRWQKDAPFQYWVGMFLPEGTAVPEGYGHVDFPASTLGVVWLRGDEGDLYGKEDKCAGKLADEGYKVISDGEGAYWFFERYGCPRFTTPDAEGKVILDVCHYIQ